MVKMFYYLSQSIFYTFIGVSLEATSPANAEVAFYFVNDIGNENVFLD